MQFLGHCGKAARPWMKPAFLRGCGVAAAAALALGVVTAPALASAKFAAMTVDARNGKVLFAENADAIRHPASLTKMMTLYLLFQDMSAGKLTLDSPITVSKRCAGMAPSKLGVKPGGSVTAQTATRALVVKSANDIACAVAETLGGSESAFAKRMTRTARDLGMSRTTFLNASGLPNSGQVTTARDMATLGLRLMRDYPQYYPYFRTRSFVYQGRTIKGHNRLLGSYEGTDGIKTGYINASGFNLVSSVRRGDKRLVGVVLGGKSGASRDAYMKQMLSKYFDDATGGRTIAAYAGSSKGVKTTDETEGAATTAEVTTKPARKETAAKRLAQKTTKAPEEEVAAATPAEPSEQGDTEDAGDSMANLAAQAASPVTTGTTTLAEQPALQVETMPQPTTSEDAAQQPADQAQMASIAAGTDAGWTITLGDYATKADAQAVLQMTRKRTPDVTAGKTAQTVMVEKKGQITYRARFTGFDESTAAMACKAIKKKKTPCQPQGPS